MSDWKTKLTERLKEYDETTRRESQERQQRERAINRWLSIVVMPAFTDLKNDLARRGRTATSSFERDQGLASGAWMEVQRGWEDDKVTEYRFAVRSKVERDHAYVYPVINGKDGQFRSGTNNVEGDEVTVTTDEIIDLFIDGYPAKA
jgi:hypothetical protein